VLVLLLAANIALIGLYGALERRVEELCTSGVAEAPEDEPRGELLSPRERR
jgi:hypothetical protein